jgi:hypothetical protein
VRPIGSTPLPRGESRPQLRLALGTALATLAVLACNASPSNLPTHRAFSGNLGSPAAETEGLLASEDGCLYLDDGVVRLVPIWPSGYWLDDQTLKLGSQEISKVGAHVRLTGGSYQRLQDVADLLVTAVPASCRADGYWLVADRGVVPKATDP